MYLSVHFYKIGNTIFLALCKTYKRYHLQKVEFTAFIRSYTIAALATGNLVAKKQFRNINLY